MSDPVNHPAHYTSHPSGVEAITVVRHMPFALGNAVKYLWRSEHKGKAIEDIKKARWYINDAKTNFVRVDMDSRAQKDAYTRFLDHEPRWNVVRVVDLIWLALTDDAHYEKYLGTALTLLDEELARLQEP